MNVKIASIVGNVTLKRNVWQMILMRIILTGSRKEWRLVVVVLFNGLIKKVMCKLLIAVVEGLNVGGESV